MRIFQGTDDRFIVMCTDCIVALASDTSLGSVTFITDSCGAVGIVETLCSAIAGRPDAECEVCTAILRCLQLLVHHHVANQCRLCACGGLAVATQVIVRCNAAQRSCDSVRWAVAIVAHVASSSRAGFDAAMSCGGVDAVFMAGVLCSAQTQAAIAGAIFDMVCSGPQVAAVVRHQCDVEDSSHIQPFSLLLQSCHADIRRVAHSIVTRIGSKVEERSAPQPRTRDRVQQPGYRWK